MTAVKHLQPISVAEYLASEALSPVKHEYCAGFVYAMADPTNLHGRIATNALVELGLRLRNRPCEPWNSATKIRIRFPTHTCFYYPDMSVVRHSNSPNDWYQDAPVAIVEVLSPSTRRIDECEKKDAYLSISSLALYLLVETDAAAVTVYRRTDEGFEREVHEGLDTILPLPEIGVELPLRELYEGVAFAPDEWEPEDR
jgi:Uma2 family endonuclease